jgi:hypothetical protein
MPSNEAIFVVPLNKSYKIAIVDKESHFIERNSVKEGIMCGDRSIAGMKNSHLTWDGKIIGSLSGRHYSLYLNHEAMCECSGCEPRNRAGEVMRLGTGNGSRIYYCGRYLGKSAIPHSDGRCGPNNGPQCRDCLQGTTPHENIIRPLLNKAGVAMNLGTFQHYRYVYYCGRYLGTSSDKLVNYYDGRCGPSGGPQCTDCRDASVDIVRIATAHDFLKYKRCLPQNTKWELSDLNSDQANALRNMQDSRERSSLLKFSCSHLDLESLILLLPSYKAIINDYESGSHKKRYIDYLFNSRSFHLYDTNHVMLCFKAFLSNGALLKYTNIKKTRLFNTSRAIHSDVIHFLLNNGCQLKFRRQLIENESLGIGAFVFTHNWYRRKQLAFLYRHLTVKVRSFGAADDHYSASSCCTVGNNENADYDILSIIDKNLFLVLSNNMLRQCIASFL